MKNAAYIIPIFFILLLPLVAAVGPELLYEVDVDGVAGTRVRMHEIDSTHLAILDTYSTSIRLRIVNPTTGVITDQSTSGGINIPFGVDYEGGTIVVCAADRISSGFADVVIFYKIPLSSQGDGFMNQVGYYSRTTTDGSFSGCVIDESSSTSGKAFVQNYGKTFIQPDKDGRVTVWFNGSSNSFAEEPVQYPTPHLYNQQVDTSNEVFANGDEFINNSDPYNNTGKILDTLILGDAIAQWNRNANSPEWVTQNGYLVIADDYSNIIESSGSATMDLIIAHGGRDEIIGIINGTWYVADFTNAAVPVVTSTGVDIPDAGDDAINYFTTSTRIYSFNATSGKLTTWEYQAAETCSASDGCYIEDNFNYDDTVLNHGWTGTGVEPINNSLECYGNPGRHHRYYFTPITSSTGQFFLDFNATMCGSSSSEIYLSLYSNNDIAWNIRMKADALGGTIQDHASNYLSLTVGDTVNDTENYCTGLDRFENSYRIVFNPQNVPRTYDIYINGQPVSEGNQWTAIGQNVLSVNNFDLAVGTGAPYCWWRVDNIHLYTLSTDDQLTDDAILEARNTIGGVEMSLGTQFHFDRDEHCEVTENSQLCFLRWIVGGILDWLWRLIVNNPLQSLAFILIAIVLVIAGHNSKK